MRFGRFAAAFKVLGGKAKDGKELEIITSHLIKSGKLSVVDSKYAFSTIELKVPRNFSPEFYFQDDFLSLSYPWDKVSVKYHVTEQDKVPLVKAARKEAMQGFGENLAQVVVIGSAVELLVKTISEVGPFLKDPFAWVVDILGKPKIDKIDENIREMQKDLLRLSKDMAMLKKHFGTGNVEEKKHAKGGEGQDKDQKDEKEVVPEEEEKDNGKKEEEEVVQEAQKKDDGNSSEDEGNTSD